MNRLTHPFSSVQPSSGSDAGSSYFPRESPRVSSPVDQVSSFQSSILSISMYDDPRSVYESASSFGKTTYPSRSMRDRAAGSRTPRGTEEINKGFQVNLMASAAQGKRGWGMSNVMSGSRLTGMVKGPEGKYAVGGGQYLRVLQISSEGDESSIQPFLPVVRGRDGTVVSEVANLWRGSWSVGKDVTDLDWGVGAFSDKLVTTTPSGNILIFDITRGRLEREVSGGHPRPLNVVKFSRQYSKGHTLITGGTEGQVKLWDLRESDPQIRKTLKHSVPVTSLCFAPDDSHQFVVGLENGAIQRYDLRYQNKATGRVWGAHGNKPVTDLRWKAEDDDRESWLASAGADRTVQIWDMSESWDRSPTPVHTLHTAYPLRRVAWRLGHDTELLIVPLDQPLAASNIDPSITSIPQGHDSHPSEHEARLEIWDVRRHYIAKYSLPTQDGSAVDVAWSDDSTVIACFRDGGFAQLDMDHRGIPLDMVPRQVMAWNAQGELAYALDRFKLGEIPFDDLRSDYGGRWDRTVPKATSISDPSYEPLQAIGILPTSQGDKLAYMAHHYRLEGDSPEHLCQRNSEIAGVCGQDENARFWLFLKLLIQEFSPSSDNNVSSPHSASAPPSSRTTPRAGLGPPPEISMPSPPSHHSQDTSVDTEAIEELLAVPSTSTSPSTTPSRFTSFVPPGAPIRPSEVKLTKVSTTKMPPSGVRDTPRITMRWSNEEGSSSSSDESVGRGTPYAQHQMTSSRILDDYPDPYGIDPDHSFGPRASPLPPPSSNGRSRQASPMLLPAIMSDNIIRRSPLKDTQTVTPAKHGADGFDAKAWEAYRRNRSRPVLHWWQAFIDDGEVQIATASFAIGSSFIDFPKQRCERVAHAYVELLERHRLHVPAAYIRRHASIPSLESLHSNDGMTRLIRCGRCMKSTGSLEDVSGEKKFWWCKRCRAGAEVCAICHQSVKGLWMGCNTCLHGGHQQCMRMYHFETEPMFTTMPPHTARPAAPSAPPSQVEPSTSHDSSGYVARSSGETARSSEPALIVAVDSTLGWQPCPTGCGCLCAPFKRERRPSG